MWGPEHCDEWFEQCSQSFLSLLLSASNTERFSWCRFSWGLIYAVSNNDNRLYSTPDTPQAGVQRHHTGMRGAGGAGVAPVGCQPQGLACRQHCPCGALVPAEAGPNFAAWWAGVHVCEQLTQGCYAVCLGRGSNSRPSDRESRALPIEPPRHIIT